MIIYLKELRKDLTKCDVLYEQQEVRKFQPFEVSQ